MNKLEAESEKIRGDTSRSTLDEEERKERKKHKRKSARKEKEGSKSKSSHRKDDTSVRTSKSSEKHSSSKKKKKKKKHKKRSPSPSLSRNSAGDSMDGGEEPPPASKQTCAAKRPSSDSDNDVSSVASVDSIEAHAPAVFEVFTRDKDGMRRIMEKEPSVYVPPLEASESSSDESQSEGVDLQRKPAATKQKESKRSPRRRSEMDRHKKEVVGALTPEQVAVPRTPARASRSAPKSSSSGGLRPNEGVMKPQSSREKSSSGTTGSSSSRRPAPSALKPLKSTGDDRHKKELMRELCPDQFMTMTRKPVTFGRRGSGGGSETSNSRSSTSLNPASSGTSLSHTTSHSDIIPPSPSGQPPEHLNHTPPSPRKKSADTFDDDNNHARHFKLKGFHRKGRKKSH